MRTSFGFLALALAWLLTPIALITLATHGRARMAGIYTGLLLLGPWAWSRANSVTDPQLRTYLTLPVGVLLPFYVLLGAFIVASAWKAVYPDKADAKNRQFLAPAPDGRVWTTERVTGVALVVCGSAFWGIGAVVPAIDPSDMMIPAVTGLTVLLGLFLLDRPQV